MRTLLAAVLLLAGCSRAPELPEGQALYSAKDAAFSLHGPADWRVAEDQGGTHRVTFLGPPPAVETIAVYRHEGGDAKAYLAGQALSGRTAGTRRIKVGERDAVETILEKKSPAMHGKPSEPLRVRVVVLEDSKGFWALVNTAPAGKSSTGAFDESVRSFRPAP